MKKEYDFSQGKRGAPLAQAGKTRITIYIDDEVLEVFRRRATVLGRGYQTLINEVLRESTGHSPKPVDVQTLRRVLREELHRAG